MGLDKTHHLLESVRKAAAIAFSRKYIITAAIVVSSILQEHLEHSVYSYQGVKTFVVSSGSFLKLACKLRLFRRHSEMFSMQCPLQEHRLDLYIQEIQTEGI